MSTTTIHSPPPINLLTTNQGHDHSMHPPDYAGTADEDFPQLSPILHTSTTLVEGVGAIEGEQVCRADGTPFRLGMSPAMCEKENGATSPHQFDRSLAKFKVSTPVKCDDTGPDPVPASTSEMNGTFSNCTKLLDRSNQTDASIFQVPVATSAKKRKRDSLDNSLQLNDTSAAGIKKLKRINSFSLSKGLRRNLSFSAIKSPFARRKTRASVVNDDDRRLESINENLVDQNLPADSIDCYGRMPMVDLNEPNVALPNEKKHNLQFEDRDTPVDETMDQAVEHFDNK